MKLKTTLLSVALAIVASNAQGQTQGTNRPTSFLEIIKSKPNQFGAGWKAPYKAKPTNNDYYLLKAFTLSEYMVNASVLTDSIALTWHGDAGKNVNVMDYLNLHIDEEMDIPTILENMHRMNVYNLKHTQYYPGNDTLIKYDVNSPGVSQVITANYNSNNLQDTIRVDSDPNELTVYHYNSNNDIVSVSGYNGTNLDRYDSVFYNANNLVTKFLQGDGTDEEFNEYTYDANGKVVTAKYHSYDATNNIIYLSDIDSIFYLPGIDSVVSYYHDGTGYVYFETNKAYHTNGIIDSVIRIDFDGINNSERSFVYERNANGQITKVGFYDDGNLEENGYITYNANDQFESFVLKMTDGIVEMEDYGEFHTYDTAGNLVRFETFDDYDDQNNVWVADDYDVDYRFYYDFYADTTSTHKITATDVQVYPNPTQDMLQIKLADGAISGITVYDLSGRIIMKQKGTQQSTMTLATDKITTGNYILTVNSNKGQGVVKFTKL